VSVSAPYGKILVSGTPLTLNNEPYEGIAHELHNLFLQEQEHEESPSIRESYLQCLQNITLYGS